jgi:hypothetical protein
MQFDYGECAATGVFPGSTRQQVRRLGFEELSVEQTRAETPGLPGNVGDTHLYISMGVADAVLTQVTR